MNRFQSPNLLLALALAWPACAQPDRAALQAHGLWSNSGAGAYDDNSDVDDPEDHNVVVSLAADADPASPSRCTGLLLTPTRVLTTASCTLPAKAGARPFVRIGAQRPYAQVVATTDAQLFTTDVASEPSLSGRDLALLTLRDFVFEKAFVRRPSLQPALPIQEAPAGQAEAFAQLVFTGWSPFNAVPQVSPFADHRQVLTKDPAVLYRYARASDGHEPFLVLRAFGPEGEVQYGLAAGDSGAPLFRVVGGQWDPIGIASIIGDPADPDLRAQPLPALAASCAPLPGLDVASECDAWIDLTADSTRSWILQNVVDNSRGPRWKTMHRPFAGDTDLWYGDVDYYGPCQKDDDPDCDHIYTYTRSGRRLLARDNCPTIYNPDQIDSRDEGRGDACAIELRLLAGHLGGSGSQDGVGDAARFNWPAGVTSDGAGHVYVADMVNSVVRTLDVASGTVSTLAGLAGSAGSSDGVGAAARFAQPVALTYDGAGDLYVSDSQNAVIRKIVIRTGQVSTVAGLAGSLGTSDGVGSAARFYWPAGISWDHAGSLYVADTSNTIRKIDVASGTVTTVAGVVNVSGSSDGPAHAALFDAPTGVFADGAGHVYITDLLSSTVRQLDVTTNQVTTLAGSAAETGFVDGVGSAARFNTPFDLTSDGAGGLLISDTFNQSIRRLDLTTSRVSTVAGSPGYGAADGIGAAAQLGAPFGIVADGLGTFIFADQTNQLVRRLDAATGAVTTVAGSVVPTGSQDGAGVDARFDLPSAITSDADGNVYVSDRLNATIRKVAADGITTTLAGAPGIPGFQDGLAAAARFNGPGSLTVDNAGNLYVIDQGNCIRKIVLATGQVTTLAGSRAAGHDDGIGSAASFTSPVGLAADWQGNLYTADLFNADGTNTIRKIVPATGEVSTFLGSGVDFKSVGGLASDGYNLYVADSGHQQIQRVTLSPDVAVGVIAGARGTTGTADGTALAARFNRPTSLAYAASTLYIVDENNRTIRALDLTYHTVTTMVGVAGNQEDVLGRLPASLSGPTGVAAVSDGRIIILETQENALLFVR